MSSWGANRSPGWRVNFLSATVNTGVTRSALVCVCVCVCVCVFWGFSYGYLAHILVEGAEPGGYKRRQQSELLTSPRAAPEAPQTSAGSFL